MAWRYNGARFLGNKTNPAAGDEVAIQLRDPSTNEIRVLHFEYDGTLSKAQFVAQVKAKVRNRLRRLNSINVEDASGDFEP